MTDFTFENYREYFEEHLTDFIPDVDHKSITLYEAMKYSLSAGGKRIRPVLLLATCDFCGGKIEEALPYACALEYIHTYSLIHDDLPCMDNDDLRRGIPTNHKVYGDATATLAGDGLLNTAFESMYGDILYYMDDADAMKRRIRAAYEIAKGAGIRGMIAALIIAAVRAGAMIAGADKETLTNLTEYAENLGLAFQICDDILDVEGDEEKLGKKTGMDSDRGKLTYPALFGIEKSKERLRELTDAALAAVGVYYDNAEVFSKLAEDLAVRGN